MTEDKMTTAALRTSTLQRIKAFGSYSDTVDTILNRILDHYIKTTHKNHYGKFDGRGTIKRGLVNNGKNKKG